MITPALPHPEDEHWMQMALAQAQRAETENEVPVGSIVVLDNQVIGQGFNHPIGLHDPTAHAEIRALREAALLKRNYRLPGATLYVTIEPCMMCLGAIIHARIKRVVFGATEPRAGALVSHFNADVLDFLNHRMEYTPGVLTSACAKLIKDFFQRKRACGSPVEKTSRAGNEMPPL